jgi:hypothetical protein
MPEEHQYLWHCDDDRCCCNNGPLHPEGAMVRMGLLDNEREYCQLCRTYIEDIEYDPRLVIHVTSKK